MPAAIVLPMSTSERMAHQLRITHRCLVEDLGFTSDDLNRSLDELAAGSSDAAKFIRTFIEKRGTDPVDEDSIEDLATGRIPMHPLRRGERIRGLTWHDRGANVVWLVAAHFAHRSGERSDSYAYFRGLRADQLLPEELDYVLFREQQAIQAADAILDVIDPALRSALADPGTETRLDVGGVPVSVLVTHVTPSPRDSSSQSRCVELRAASSLHPSGFPRSLHAASAARSAGGTTCRTRKTEPSEAVSSVTMRWRSSPS
jgi:hypothetical protein